MTKDKDYKTDVFYEYSDSADSEGSCAITREPFLKAVNEIAEQECIGFAEWIDDGLMFMAHDDRWVNVKGEIRPTTKELYQLYLKSKQLK